MPYDPTKAKFTGLPPSTLDECLMQGWSSKVDEYGVQTVSATYRLPPENIESISATMIRGQTQFPKLKHCTLSQFEFESIATGIMQVQAEFIGLHPKLAQQECSWPANQIGNATASEAIETHPLFITKIGGTQGKPLNNSQWDKNGGFEGFPQTDSAGKPNSKAGVRQYFRAAVTMRGSIFVKKVEMAQGMAGAVGKVCYTGKSIGGVDIWKDSLGRDWGSISHKSTEYATVPGKGTVPRNWLMTKCDCEQHGNLLRLSYELALSEVKGIWDYEIYEDAK